ncbi:MAG: hypothetical protein KR126chlam1_00573 [Chlamydiae bacterium]|nr:hypothetical protein [Chlamydiota bacterium]
MSEEFLKKEGEKYGDFSLVTSHYIDELQTHLREIIHLPTGAQVMHLENEDPENVFCLSFKTLPSSSDGAPHILEHTVLCGSRKFPVKDPFFAMNRRSLNTYMNALTGSDFTCYPAASQVEKDFYNLLEVYLDAVFHPELKHLSFLQEGHRLEFAQPQNPKSPLEYKGIVYNEMKGALSSADSRIWHSLISALVPDLTYAHNSGGDPKEIPNLTYAQLVEFHETFYHPSRCLFFFYGNFPLKKHLDFIAENALKNVTKASPLDGIGHQKRFSSPITLQKTYPTNETENLETKHIHTFGWLTTPLLDQEEVLALTILDSILMDTDASLLKKPLLDSKLCIHADCYIDTEMTEVPLTIICRGCKEEDGKPLKEILFDTLRTIAEEGIPFPLVEASIHQLEFSRIEILGDHSPFGLTLFMRSALAKQHGCNPEAALSLHTLFNKLLEKAKDPFFFTPLIEKYILQNPHFVQISFAPDPELIVKEAKEEEKNLVKVKESLNEKQIAKILEETDKLEKFHESTEEQQLDCLPKVGLADVPAETRDFSLDIYKREELEILHHDTFTNHIAYADLIFPLPSLEEKELFDVQLFTTLWTELGVGEKSYLDTLEFVHAHTGGIGGHASLHVQASDSTLITPTLELHGKVLERKIDYLFPLFEELVTRPRFDEEERIEDLIKKLAVSMQNRLPRSAMRYASQLSLASFSLPTHINELWHGLSFYKYIQSLANDIDIKKVVENLSALSNKLLCNGSADLVLSCDAPLFKTIDKKGFFDLQKLPTKQNPDWAGDFSLPSPKHQAYDIASPVAFTAQGHRTVGYTHKDAPALQVATLLLENKVLHHRIREQGGAYGSGANYNSLWGTFYFYAYRDPHIARTLRTFQSSVDAIAAGDFDANDLEEAKLGIIQHFDTPVSPGGRALISYTWLRDGKTRQMRQDFRDQLLSLTMQDVQEAVATHLQAPFDDGVIVTFAGKELFEKELPLIEDKSLEIQSIS